MPYWDRYPYKTETHNGLPQEVLSGILTQEEVEAKLAAGEDPIEVSILKWEKLIQFHGTLAKRDWPYIYYSEVLPYIGYTTCALCIDAIARYSEEHGSIKYKGDKCKVCPLAEVNMCIDEGSIYFQIVSILEKDLSFTVSAQVHESCMEENIHLKYLLGNMVELLKGL